MTADDHIERLLRRSADDVRAAIVVTTTPPPITDFERGRGPWVVVASVVLVLAGVGGLLTAGGNGDDEVAPAAPSSIGAPVDQPLVPPQSTTDALCAAVAESTAALESTPTETESWQQADARLASVETAADDAALDADDRRRLDRFLLLGGLAVERGVNGEQLTAAARADEAAAVGRDLIISLDVPGCTAASSTSPTLTPGGS